MTVCANGLSSRLVCWVCTPPSTVSFYKVELWKSVLELHPSFRVEPVVPRRTS
jgi:hypothetical protein